MSSVLDRDELIASPLADLHVIANELGVDGFRRLRKSALVDAIVARQSGEAPADTPEDAATAEPETQTVRDPVGEDERRADDSEEGRRGRRSRRGGRARSRVRGEEALDPDAAPAEAADGEPEDDRTVVGVVELLANGSGFLRLNHPEVSDDDVYVSAAQVKRCELVSGDRVAGPVRAPRRSERHPSLVRIAEINGRPADEVAEGTRFDDLRAVFPAERFELGGDAVLIDRLAPIGKGSRVTVAGEPHTGKSELLRRIAEALTAVEGLEVAVVLAGVRPEEIGEWPEDGVTAPAGAVPLGASPDAQGQAVEQAIDQGRRVAARGGDAVVIVDTLEQVPPAVARRALGAARNLADAGSLTVIAANREPVGGETTVIRLDPLLAATGRFPAISPVESFTMRPELLVGEKAAKRAREERAKKS